MIENVNGVEFKVSDDGKLVRMTNLSDTAISVTIPRVLPSGKEIERLGNTFCFGRFSEVVVSDEIQNVASFAFSCSTIDTVVWPSGCAKIPSYCFSQSKINKIVNIDHVSEVGKFAFVRTNIKEISWPSSCSVIPESCFAYSELRHISNLDHIREISEHAFAYSALESLDLLNSSVSYIGEFAFANINPDSVVLPYYLPENVSQNMFLKRAKM